MSSLNRYSRCSDSLVIGDKFLAKCSSVLSFKRFSLLLTSRLLRLISSRRLFLSTWSALSSSLFLKDIVHSFLLCYPLCWSILLRLMLRCPTMASQVVVPPYRFQVTWCWSRLGSRFSASTSLRDPLLVPQVGYIALCFCSSHFSSPILSWSQSLLTGLINLRSCLLS